MACNDYILLDTCLYRILRRYFSKSSHYTQLLDLFHEVPPHPTLPLLPSSLHPFLLLMSSILRYDVVLSRYELGNGFLKLTVQWLSTHTGSQYITAIGCMTDVPVKLRLQYAEDCHFPMLYIRRLMCRQLIKRQWDSYWTPSLRLLEL